MLIRYSTYALCLLTYITLGATYEESLPLYINTGDVELFEITFNQLLTDAWVSKREKQDITLSLLTLIKDARTVLTHKASLPTDTTRMVKGTAQLVVGTLAFFHAFFTTGPLVLWFSADSKNQWDELIRLYTKNYFFYSDNKLRPHLFPCNWMYNTIIEKVDKKIFDDLDNNIMPNKAILIYAISAATALGFYGGSKLGWNSINGGIAGLTVLIYAIIGTAVGLYGGTKLYSSGYANLTHKQHTEHLLDALDAIEQLILTSTLRPQKEIA